MNGRDILQRYRDTETALRRWERSLEKAQSQEERDTLSCRLWETLATQIIRRRELERVLARLPTERDRIMFRLRYVDAMTWVEISGIMGLCYARVCKLHGKLLDGLEDGTP